MDGATSDANLMTIREMCDAFDVTPRALRFYEAKELLSPIRRGQHRLYNRRDRVRLTLILRGKRFRFSLEEIRQTLDLYDVEDGNRLQLVKALGLSKANLDKMLAQRDELNLAIEDLRRHMSVLNEMLLEEDGTA